MNKKLLFLITIVGLFSQLIFCQTSGNVLGDFGSAPGFNYSVYSSFNYRVTAVVIQPDGKALVVGDFTKYNGLDERYLIRLNLDGTKDTSFNTGSGFNNYVTNIILQPDGKILVGGIFTSYNGISTNKILRLNSDGTLDITFNTETFFNTSNSQFLCQLIQPDGKILLGWQYGSIFKVFRLNSDGSIDSSFNSGTGFNNRVNTIAIQSDGKILVGGQFIRFNEITENNIIRLNPDGSKDSSFLSGTGFNSSVFGINVYAIKIQSDGKILVGGNFSTYNGVGGEQNLIRLNSNGTIDNSFSTSTGNIFTNGFNNIVNTIAVQNDGKILVGGDFTRYKGQIENRIIRLNIDGSKDSSFNVGTGFANLVTTIAIQNNGKIIIGGTFRTYNEFTSNCIIRLESNGLNDSNFNTNTINGFDNVINATVYQPDGKILVGGEFTSYNGLIKNYILRLNIDRTIDSNFNIGTGFDNKVRTIALQPDGKILIGGDFSLYNGVAQRSLIRLNSDGSKDSNFPTFSNLYGDFQLPNCSGCVGPVNSIVLQSDGKILLGGNYRFGPNNRYFLTRLNTDGTNDTSFSLPYLIDQQIYTIFLQPDGKILLGGEFTDYNGVPTNKIIRLNSNGSPDINFNVGSGFINFQGQACYIKSINLQQDGKILVGGNFVSYNGNIQGNLIRLNSNGTFDGSFAPLAILNSEVFAIGMQPDGKIIVGGKFTSYNGLIENYIIRLNNDGTKDNSFNTGLGFNNFVSSITVGSNSKILVGGAFTTYKNTNASSYLIELNGNFGNLSIDDIVSEKITYYPNPVFDILNISASTELKNAKICNLLGQTIFQQRFNSNEIQLNMGDVPVGTYFVIVESDDRKETFKILKK